MHKIIAFLLFVGVLFFGCASNATNPQPIEEFDEMVALEVNQFFNLRAEEGDRARVAAAADVWQKTTSLIGLSAWFESFFGTPLWDFAPVITNIKTSEEYKAENPTDADLLEKLKRAIAQEVGL